MKTMFCLVSLAVLLCACGNSTGDNSKGIASSTDPPTASTCEAACQDGLVAYGVDDTMWLLWNQNFAGQASGNQNKSATCPLGGTAVFTGTTGASTNGINTVHLTAVLQNCARSKSSYSLSFTGTVTMDGSFSTGNPNAISFKSSALALDGSVTWGVKIAISENCVVALTDSYNASVTSQSSWLNGQICGRTASK